MKRITALAILVLTFFSISPTLVFADTPTPEPQPTDAAPIAISYKINDLAVGDDSSLLSDLYTLPDKRIDGNTRIAWVQFTNLDSTKTYALCGGFESGTCQNGFKPAPDGTITMAICGNGEETVKGVQVQGYKSKIPTGGKLKEKCDESRDFFHEGHIYKVSLYFDYTDKSDRPNPNDETTSIIAAKFLVAHSYPLVKVNSANALTDPVAITLWGRRPGNDNSNNYQVVVEGTDNAYKKEHCYTVPDKNWQTDNLTVGIDTQFDAKKNLVVPEFILNGTGFNVPARPMELGKTNTYGRGKDESNGNLGRGIYIVKINEEKSDNRPLGIGNNCEGGFTYMNVYFQIGQKGDIKILKVAYDPNNSDRNDIEEVFPVPQIPCAEGAFDKDTQTCNAFNVALLGKIPLDPYSFIKSVYNIVLSVAGISAIAIIIRSGYKFLYSRGDKEAIADARARLTSAIIGLAFIIFAYVILSIIGVDILKLPGFG